MKVRFKSKVTRGFSFSPLRESCFHRFAALSQLSHAEKNQEKRKIKKNLWDQGTQHKVTMVLGATTYRFIRVTVFRYLGPVSRKSRKVFAPGKP